MIFERIKKWLARRRRNEFRNFIAEINEIKSYDQVVLPQDSEILSIILFFGYYTYDDFECIREQIWGEQLEEKYG